MSDSVQPHGRQPTRFPHLWDSPGKNTGVGCHLLQSMKVKSESEVVQSCLTLSNPMDCSLPGSSVHGIFQARVLEWGAIAFSDHQCYFLINLLSGFSAVSCMLGMLPFHLSAKPKGCLILSLRRKIEIFNLLETGSLETVHSLTHSFVHLLFFVYSGIFHIFICINKTN